MLYERNKIKPHVLMSEVKTSADTCTVLLWPAVWAPAPVLDLCPHLGTGGVSWRTRLVPVWGDALSAEPVSTAGGDWILQDVLTRSTAGRLLLLRNMTPLPLSVKTFPDNSHVTVTGCHYFCQGGFVFTQYVCVLVGLFVRGIIKKHWTDYQ